MGVHNSRFYFSFLNLNFNVLKCISQCISRKICLPSLSQGFVDAFQVKCLSGWKAVCTEMDQANIKLGQTLPGIYLMAWQWCRDSASKMAWSNTRAACWKQRLIRLISQPTALLLVSLAWLDSQIHANPSLVGRLFKEFDLKKWVKILCRLQVRSIR